MISLGVLLVILGVGSLILPYLNLQFTFMELVDPYQPWAGIIVAALGLITVLFGAQRRGRKEVVVEPAAATPAAAATTAATTPPVTTPAQPPAPSPAEADAAQPPPTPTPAADSRAWPTEPPERSDD